MQYIRATAQDMLGTLPPGEQAELVAIVARAVVEETAERDDGRGWIAVPDIMWTRFTEAVRRGEGDR